MKTRNVSGFLFLLALTTGCIEDSDLHRTIFVRDKKYPDLPQYSEWGYNTFGAFVNEDVFVSGNFYWDPASLFPVDTTLILSFHGEKRTREKDTADMILSFVIPRRVLLNEDYLLALDDCMVDLKTSASRVLISFDTTEYPVILNSGKLHFTRVQKLVVDNAPEETILSGTFEFDGVMDGNPVSVILGRFDVGVSYFY